MLAWCLLAIPALYGQSISFRHLNTSNGLSDINVTCMTVDKNGFLWIGTTYGLNVYDGYSITTYLKDQDKELPSNIPSRLYCDQENNIWVITSEGIAMADANRKFHRVSISDTIKQFYCKGMEETKTYGKILYTNLGQFAYNERSKSWSKLDGIPDRIAYSRIRDIGPFGPDKKLFVLDSAVIIYDYAAKKIIFDETYYPLIAAYRLNDHEVAIGMQIGKVKIIDIATKELKKEYPVTTLSNGQYINTNLTDMQCSDNGDILLTTGFAGMIMIDKNGKLNQYTHDPLNPNSISSNNTTNVMVDKNGNVFVASNAMGLDICNINTRQATYNPVFIDKSGELYDNYENEIVEDSDGSIWMGAYDRLIHWDRKTGRSAYYYYYIQNPMQGLRAVEVKSLCFDHKGRLWLCAIGGGVAIMNKQTGEMKKIPHDTIAGGPGFISHYVHNLVAGSDGYIWGCSNTGLLLFDPATLKPASIYKYSKLVPLLNRRIIGLYEDKQQNMWISVSRDGIYKYNLHDSSLVKFTLTDGLLSDVCYGLTSDKRNNFYAFSQAGFSMIDNQGRITTYNKQNGLRYNRCTSAVEDDNGYMWIVNNKCLVKFDPVKKTMEIFDENEGLSEYGFKSVSLCKLSSGELLFGGSRGVNSFFPNNINNITAELKLSIYKALLKDTIAKFSANSSFELPYEKNTVHFFFTAINLLGSKEIQYQYMLEGYDKEWQHGTDIREVRYTSLSPGTYTFKVKASRNGIAWVDSSNKIEVTIIAPVWQRAWFIILVALLLSGLIYLLARYRNKVRKEEKEEEETQKVINYFASSVYQQQSVSSIVWDVTKNCISRLHFQHCVIYLLDEENNSLIQKAAHGPKNPWGYEIRDPMTLPLGKGIVGVVAKIGKAEIIADTSKDPRYIVDDEQRFSEIAVPIISDGKVLGVIDCEHSTRNHFNQKHLNMLSTIASLCANKITRAKAEEEKTVVEKSLVDTKQKMADVEMQALRAQMNPHFIFNCLNSINRYIVKSDQATASLYLTRFAKLIRLILDNSNSKNVILSNEIEALRLYIEMEALRFEKKFSYDIQIDDSVNTDSLEVPPLIIQPYVENAIWHGLLHKESGGHLTIRIKLINDSVLECTIEDNGVGREKATELKSKSATTRKSLGMQLTENRIALLNQHSQYNASVEIIDLKKGDMPTGTKVILKIPV